MSDILQKNRWFVVLPNGTAKEVATAEEGDLGLILNPLPSKEPNEYVINSVSSHEVVEVGGWKFKLKNVFFDYRQSNSTVEFGVVEITDPNQCVGEFKGQATCIKEDDILPLYADMMAIFVHYENLADFEANYRNDNDKANEKNPVLIIRNNK